MADKYFYIGSSGPFFYDDTDALNDPDGNFPGGTLQDVMTGDGSINIGGLTTLGTISAGVLKILDTGADHTLRIKPNEDLSADRILNLLVADSDQTVNCSKILSEDEYDELHAWLDNVVLADGGAITTTQVATFAQLVLTPRAAALSAVQGGIFYDSDDSSVYVCTEGA